MTSDSGGGTLPRWPLAMRLPFQIVLAAAIPLILFSVWVGYVAADRERTEARRTALERMNYIAHRVGAELATEKEVAEVLASSASLISADLAEFRAEAIRVAQARTLWENVSLFRPDGSQMMNILRPPGTITANPNQSEVIQKALASKQSVIDGVGSAGDASGKRLVALTVPVIINGDVAYVLKIGLDPARVRSILEVAGAPRGWIGAIADGNGRIIARTSPDNFEVGSRASDTLLDAVRRDRSGFYEGREVNGLKVETVFRYLPETEGWTIHFAVPKSDLNGPVRRALLLFAGGAAMSLIMAGGLAATISGDIARRRQEADERAELALKVSENKAAVAVEAADLGTWICNPRLQTLTLSAKAWNILQDPTSADVAADQVLVLQDFLQLVAPRDREKVAKAFAACAPDVCDLDIEFQTTSHGGPGRWIRMRGRNLDARKSNGEIHGVIADIDDQKRGEEERLLLLRRLGEAQEAERRRIARELHDQVGQAVTGVALGLKTLDDMLKDSAAREQVAWLRRYANEIGRDIHRVSTNLRPTSLDDLGLQEAVAAYARDWSDRHGVFSQVRCFGRASRMPSEIETAAFRAIQEALTNALKHAQAQNVSIVLEQRPEELKVLIEDDGVGFDPDRIAKPHHHLGLSGIRERLALLGGELAIESAFAVGTTLFIRIPLAEEVALA